MVLFFLMVGIFAAKAQPQFCGLTYGQCKDTISPIYVAPYLPNDVAPVCGCDGKTYRNINYMWAQNLCFTQFNGPCEEVYMYMTPNPISGTLPLSSPIANFTIFSRSYNTIYFQVSDIYGNLYIRENYPLDKTPQNTYAGIRTLNLGNLPKGVYVANAIAGGQRAFFKFVVMN